MKLRVVVDKKTGALAFLDGADKEFVREKLDAPQKVTPKTISGKPTYETENTFTLQPDEAIYGFGFVDPAKVNRRGRELLLVQTNIGIVIPMMVSSRRYGVMWDTYSKMTFKDDSGGEAIYSLRSSALAKDCYSDRAGRCVRDSVRSVRWTTCGWHSTPMAFCCGTRRAWFADTAATTPTLG